jgi:Family of unknown function (DUF6134)
MKLAPSSQVSRRAFGRLALGALIVTARRAYAADGPLFSTVPERRLSFDVIGLGQVIGSHEVRVEGTSSAFVVRSDVDIDVSPLGIPLFTYRHSGTETWKNDRLVAFESESQGDERADSVVGRAIDGGFEVKGRKGTIVAPADIMVGSYWTSRMMSRPVLLDPQKGVIEKQIIHSRDRTAWEVRGHPRPVTLYRISSILNGEVAYDDSGRWVGARFKKKSAQIEYRLRT